MPRYLYATAPDGSVVRRQTDREYAFAVLVAGEDDVWSAPSWSSRLDLAEKLAAPFRTRYRVAVVPVRDTADDPGSQVKAEIRNFEQRQEDKRQAKIAELVVLQRFNVLRSRAGHDYGSGQRVAELIRRRQELGVDRYDELEATAAEQVAAFVRVGQPRLDRAAAQGERRGFETPTGRRTVETWRKLAAQIERSASFRRELEEGPTTEELGDRLASVRIEECEGHPAGPFDPMGETVYCDGSCRPSPPEHRIRVEPAFALGGYAVFCSCGNLTGFAGSRDEADELGETHKLDVELAEAVR